MKKDDLGDRMKKNYENRTRNYLPRRTNTIIRLDGKAFHTFTKKFNKPYDNVLASSMDMTARDLCENIQGAVMAYIQSDEISILLTDYENLNTDAWFDGNIQKITSVSASMCTGYFNQHINRFGVFNPELMAFFDSRVFTIPETEEVINYFIWRQQDAVRNSIQMLAQSLYSHKELMNKNSSELQEMCFQKGENWNDVNGGFKRGRIIVKVPHIRHLSQPNSEGNLFINSTKFDSINAFDFNKQRDVFKNYLIDKVLYEQDNLIS